MEASNLDDQVTSKKRKLLHWLSWSEMRVKPEGANRSYDPANAATDTGVAARVVICYLEGSLSLSSSCSHACLLAPLARK
jgi:hypothetical protein